MSPGRVLSLSLSVGLALGAANAPQGNAAVAARCGKVLPPAQGVYFGIRPGWDFQMPWYDDAVSAANGPEFEALTGRRAVIVPLRTSWHDTLVFPTGEIELTELGDRRRRAGRRDPPVRRRGP
jgi:hypothetical protein